MSESKCLFCQIIAGEAPSEKVLDLADFLVIKNKYPKAPTHLLILDKQHRQKNDTIAGAYSNDSYWEKVISAINQTVKHVKTLDHGKYEVIINGPGYAHFQHEHVHILGAYTDETSSRT